MHVTRAEVLADLSLARPPRYSYLSFRVQGPVNIFCDYEGEGIWGGRLRRYSDSPVYTLSLNLLENLRDWNWLYDLYDLGCHPDENARPANEPELVGEFTQTGIELAYQVKREAPLCRVIFYDEMASLKSEGDLFSRAFDYEVLLDAAGHPWLSHVPTIKKRPTRFHHLQSRERSKVFREALCKQLLPCRSIRTVEVRQLPDDDEHGATGREMAGYVIALGRRKKQTVFP